MYSLILLLFIFIISICNGLAKDRAEVSCVSDSSWLNDYDGVMRAHRDGYWIAGQESEHNSHHEDRVFKWDYCKPNTLYDSSSNYDNVEQSPLTNYDAEWTLTCSSNYAIYLIYSQHDN